MRHLAFTLCALCALACGSEEAPAGGGGGSPSGGSGGGAGSVSSGGSGGTSSGGTSSGGGAGAPSCIAQAQGIEVAAVDLDGFPSYAVDGCQLAYVSAASKSLVLRDLTSGAETTVAPATESPRRPSLAGGLLAWEADEGGKSVVRLRSGGQTTTVAGGFDHAGEPRATADAVVFTGWLGASADGDTDVFSFTPGDASPALVAGGAGQQRFADISATHIALSDFSEDPGGAYAGDGTSLADIIVIDRATKTPTKRAASGKQAFPMLGSSGTLAYLEWVTVHPVPKLQEYAIVAVPLATLAAPATKLADVQSEEAVRPTASAGVVEWVVRWGGQSSLQRAALDGATPPAKQDLGAVQVLHAPSASSSMTVLATEKTAGSAPALVAIPR